ncbi:hypothetical protein CLOACE_19100 [Clostridium acetireducens DSM 10703]|uniref:DUF4363 domain-containing protein n=1 Tax=Clostridium acetireducens DSM 10703 TaxID=1121290 RepID=A0A1E8EWT0_9CLOT|nr:DUF4363 family protein [Clostridium acetireducens]OFI05091.1 hypothetical protein CLOACE_19100 [Clostridium acetireducens DSM 10703]
MKNTIISFIVFISTIIFISFSLKYLNTISLNLKQNNIKLENNIKENSWEKANKASEEFINQWNKSSKKLALFLNHDELDKINYEITELSYFVKTKDKDECLSRTTKIKFFLKHILELEKINIENVF